MPDEMIASHAQNSGGVRAAAVFLSARVLQPTVSVASSSFILQDGAEFIIGPHFVRTRWRFLRMRFSEPSW
jgi:hypothetical protein